MIEHDGDTLPVVVIGGTGRVGAAVVDELTARGQETVVISRRPAVDRPLVRYRVGDVHNLAPALKGIQAKALVVAVTPFTAPPPSFDGFDGTFYTRIVQQLESLLPTGSRVIVVAVTAIARLRDGSMVADHEDLFPARLRPFSDAHAHGADHLSASALDGTVLIPAAGLGVRDTRTTSHPILLAEPVTIEDATAAIDHAALAQAVADQLTATDPNKRLLVRAAFGNELAP